MVLDDCDACMEYWVSNGSNMEGYRYLASNRHIPMAHHPADNNSMHTQPIQKYSDIPQYLHPDVIFPPPPPPPADTSMLSQPDKSHNITIPEDPAMPTPPDQTSMPPAWKNKTMISRNDYTTKIPAFSEWDGTTDFHTQMNAIEFLWSPAMMETEQNHHTSTPTSSVDSEEIADPLILSQPDPSHTITIPEYPHMTNRPDQTSMPPARKNKRMTSQNDHTTTIPAFSGWGETTGRVVMEISEDERLMSTIWSKTECARPAYTSEPVSGDKPQGRHANQSSQETHKMRCLRLYKAATTGDWKSVKIIMCAHEVLKTAKIRRDSETALHVAVGCGPRTVKFVEELLNILTPSDLELTNMDGHTALGIAAMVGNLEAARLLVRKNPNLPNISSEGYAGFPIHCAAEYGHKKLLLFLLEVTTNKAYLNPDDHDYGKKFFYDIMKAEFYDVARLVIERDRSVSIWGASKGLNLLAENPSSFSFGRDTKFLKRFVEKCVPDSIIQEDSNTTWKIKLYHSLWKLCGKLVPPLNHMVERLLKYRHAVKLVSSFCVGAESNFLDAGTSTTKSLVLKFKMPMQLAATNGIHEIIEEVTKICPDAMWFYEHNNSDIFKLAIINRHPKVYNLLYELGDLYINTVRHSVDEKAGDTMLHLVAYLAPRQRLNHISGAASQMQHEVHVGKDD